MGGMGGGFGFGGGLGGGLGGGFGSGFGGDFGGGFGRMGGMGLGGMGGMGSLGGHMHGMNCHPEGPIPDLNGNSEAEANLFSYAKGLNKKEQDKAKA
jgi:hypothetical protein